MRKIIALLSVLVLMVSMLVIPVSAATKSDLLEEAAKSPVYKYVKVSVENAARTVEITDEQADAILPIVQRAVAAIPADKGSTFSNPGEKFYTDEQFATIIDCIDEICSILGYTYTFTPSSSPKHAADMVLQIFDNNGKLVFEYDGDVVKKTSAAAEVDSRLLFAGAFVLFAAGIATLAISKKRVMVK